MSQPPAPPHRLLTAQTIERWRQIVAKAARAGTDISQLVQHFAEQSFANKVALLEHQGVRRRALGNMRHVIARELERGEQAYKAPAKNKQDQLAHPYEAYRYDFLAPAPAGHKPVQERRSSKEVPLNFAGGEHGCTTVPLKPALTKRPELRAYLDALREQANKIDQDVAAIDVILNQGVRNHQAVVSELAATSRELYRIAQEVLAELPAATPTSPQPMSNDPTLTYAAPSPAAVGAAPMDKKR